MITTKFKHAIRLSEIPQYRLAQMVGLHPNQLSKIIHGAVKTNKDDSRLLQLGELLGLKAWDIFEDTNTDIIRKQQ
jgi:transcriptional regulator with XRE-family HTH domain